MITWWTQHCAAWVLVILCHCHFPCSRNQCCCFLRIHSCEYHFDFLIQQQPSHRQSPNNQPIGILLLLVPIAFLLLFYICKAPIVSPPHPLLKKSVLLFLADPLLRIPFWLSHSTTTLQQTVSKQSTHWNPFPTSAYYLFPFFFLLNLQGAYYLLSLYIITSPNISTSFILLSHHAHPLAASSGNGK